MYFSKKIFFIFITFSITVIMTVNARFVRCRHAARSLSANGDYMEGFLKLKGRMLANAVLALQAKQGDFENDKHHNSSDHKSDYNYLGSFPIATPKTLRAEDITEPQLTVYATCPPTTTEQERAATTTRRTPYSNKYQEKGDSREQEMTTSRQRTDDVTHRHDNNKHKPPNEEKENDEVTRKEEAEKEGKTQKPTNENRDDEEASKKHDESEEVTKKNDVDKEDKKQKPSNERHEGEEVTKKPENEKEESTTKQENKKEKPTNEENENEEVTKKQDTHKEEVAKKCGKKTQKPKEENDEGEESTGKTDEKTQGPKGESHDNEGGTSKPDRDDENVEKTTVSHRTQEGDKTRGKEPPNEPETSVEKPQTKPQKPKTPNNERDETTESSAKEKIKNKDKEQKQNNEKQTTKTSEEKAEKSKEQKEESTSGKAKEQKEETPTATEKTSESSTEGTNEEGEEEECEDEETETEPTTRKPNKTLIKIMIVQPTTTTTESGQEADESDEECEPEDEETEDGEPTTAKPKTAGHKCVTTASPTNALQATTTRTMYDNYPAQGYPGNYPAVTQCYPVGQTYNAAPGMQPYTPPAPPAMQPYPAPTDMQAYPTQCYPVEAVPYPAATQSYATVTQAYPIAAQPYPAATQPYPNAPQAYPPATQAYPPAAEPYPAAPQAYPTVTQCYPVEAQPYPNASQSYPVGNQAPTPEVTTQTNQQTVFSLVTTNVTQNTTTQPNVVVTATTISPVAPAALSYATTCFPITETPSTVKPASRKRRLYKIRRQTGSSDGFAKRARTSKMRRKLRRVTRELRDNENKPVDSKQMSSLVHLAGQPRHQRYNMRKLKGSSNLNCNHQKKFESLDNPDEEEGPKFVRRSRVQEKVENIDYPDEEQSPKFARKSKFFNLGAYDNANADDDQSNIFEDTMKVKIPLCPTKAPAMQTMTDTCSGKNHNIQHFKQPAMQRLPLMPTKDCDKPFESVKDFNFEPTDFPMPIPRIGGSSQLNDTCKQQQDLYNALSASKSCGVSELTSSNNEAGSAGGCDDDFGIEQFLKKSDAQIALENFRKAEANDPIQQKLSFMGRLLGRCANKNKPPCEKKTKKLPCDSQAKETSYKMEPLDTESFSQSDAPAKSSSSLKRILSKWFKSKPNCDVCHQKVKLKDLLHHRESIKKLNDYNTKFRRRQARNFKLRHSVYPYNNHRLSEHSQLVHHQTHTNKRRNAAKFRNKVNLAPHGKQRRRSNVRRHPRYAYEESNSRLNWRDSEDLPDLSLSWEGDNVYDRNNIY